MVKNTKMTILTDLVIMFLSMRHTVTNISLGYLMYSMHITLMAFFSIAHPGILNQ